MTKSHEFHGLQSVEGCGWSDTLLEGEGRMMVDAGERCGRCRLRKT